MVAPGVTTLELKRDGIVPAGSDDSLAAASGRLPPGVYTTFRTYGGDGVFRFSAHLQRLRESAALKGDELAMSDDALRGLVAAALRTTGHRESRVRLTAAGSRAFASVEAFAPRDETSDRDGVRCITLGLRREQPRAKDTRFIATAQRAYAGLPRGVEEGLLVDEAGTILEGLTSNFFAVLDGRLHTEEERVLAGITRSLVLEVAEGRVPRGEGAVRKDELPRVSEAFLTSASREVLPVVRIDDEPIGDGQVGAVTRGIMEAFAERRNRETERLI